MIKHLSILGALLLLRLAIADDASAADATPSASIWLTGEPFMRDNVLLFRTDKPIKANSTGNVILLGAPREYANIAPIFMRAAERHVKLRLYGTLIPYSGSLPVPREKLPTLEFIALKIHVPTDPDDFPEDKKIIIKPGDTVLPEYKVEVK